MLRPLMNNLAYSPLGVKYIKNFLNQDLEKWPSWVGKIYDINVPNSLVKKDQSDFSGSANINIILQFLEKTKNVNGDIAECGIFRGNSITIMGLFLKQNNINKKIFGLDSFSGFDENVKEDILLGGDEDKQKSLTGFTNTSYGLVSSKVHAMEVENIISLVPGYFEKTLPTLEERKYSFVHIDCDLKQSYATCLEYFYPRLSSGGIILFDEYNDPPWPGCKIAVDEFLENKPEEVKVVSDNNYQKGYIEKI